MSSVALELEPWSWGSWILFHPLFYTYLKENLYKTKCTGSSRGWINNISCFSLQLLRIKFPFSVLPFPVVIQESRWQHSQSSGAWLTCSARPTTAAPGSWCRWTDCWRLDKHLRSPMLSYALICTWKKKYLNKVSVQVLSCFPNIISAQLHLRVAIQDHEANLGDILGLSCLEESKSEMMNQQ